MEITEFKSCQLVLIKENKEVKQHLDQKELRKRKDENF
jgi:hypothetical protein